MHVLRLVLHILSLSALLLCDIIIEIIQANNVFIDNAWHISVYFFTLLPP